MSAGAIVHHPPPQHITQWCFSEPDIPQVPRTQSMLEVTENVLADHVQDLIGRIPSTLWSLILRVLGD